MLAPTNCAFGQNVHLYIYTIAKIAGVLLWAPAILLS